MDRVTISGPGLFALCISTAGVPTTPVVGVGYPALERSLEGFCYVGYDDAEAARFFTRPMLVRLGGFDEPLHAAKDWDFGTRARNAAGVRRRPTIMELNGRVTLPGARAAELRRRPSRWAVRWRAGVPSSRPNVAREGALCGPRGLG